MDCGPILDNILLQILDIRNPELSLSSFLMSFFRRFVRNIHGGNEEMGKNIKYRSQKKKQPQVCLLQACVPLSLGQRQNKGTISCPCARLQVIGLSGDLNPSTINFETRRSPVPLVSWNISLCPLYKNLGVP